MSVKSILFDRTIDFNKKISCNEAYIRETINNFEPTNIFNQETNFSTEVDAGDKASGLINTMPLTLAKNGAESRFKLKSSAILPTNKVSIVCNQGGGLFDNSGTNGLPICQSILQDSGECLIQVINVSTTEDITGIPFQFAFKVNGSADI